MLQPRRPYGDIVVVDSWQWQCCCRAPRATGHLEKCRLSLVGRCRQIVDVARFRSHCSQFLLFLVDHVLGNVVERGSQEKQNICIDHDLREENFVFQHDSAREVHVHEEG